MQNKEWRAVGSASFMGQLNSREPFISVLVNNSPAVSNYGILQL
jgi:hypothetical protein